MVLRHRASDGGAALLAEGERPGWIPIVGRHALEQSFAVGTGNAELGLGAVAWPRLGDQRTALTAGAGQQQKNRHDRARRQHLALLLLEAPWRVLDRLE